MYTKLNNHLLKKLVGVRIVLSIEINEEQKVKY